jgi:hypothetical protein
MEPIQHYNLQIFLPMPFVATIAAILSVITIKAATAGGLLLTKPPAILHGGHEIGQSS